jgi:hypothetical protein
VPPEVRESTSQRVAHRCPSADGWLSVIAYSLGNLWRRLVLPRRIDGCSLTSLQQRLVKTGGRLVNTEHTIGNRRNNLLAKRGNAC